MMKKTYITPRMERIPFSHRSQLLALSIQSEGGVDMKYDSNGGDAEEGW